MTPPVALAITGRPAASASIPMRPNGSGQSEGIATTDASASSCASASAASQPVKRIRSSTPSRCASLRIASSPQPSPQTTSSASTACIARIRTPMPFGVTTRPANSTRRRVSCPDPALGVIVVNSGSTLRGATPFAARCRSMTLEYEIARSASVSARTARVALR